MVDFWVGRWGLWFWMLVVVVEVVSRVGGSWVRVV